MGVAGLWKDPCGEFAEPELETVNFSRPVYLECTSDRPTCAQAARVHGVSWLQVTKYMTLP